MFNLNLNGKSNSSFFSFYKKLAHWKKNNVYPFSYNLPDVISFPSTFWTDIQKIYQDTSKDGKERAISLFWADNELIVTSVVKGDEKSVKSTHKVNVKYELHPTRKGYFRKVILVDDKTVKKVDIYHKKAPKSLSVEYLFNMHTHPPHLDNRGNNYYGFFSLQDIKSLLQSQAVVTGLVTDRLWLVVRTSETPQNIGNLVESDISVTYLKERLSMVVYMAEFNKKAIKQ